MLPTWLPSDLIWIVIAASLILGVITEVSK